MANEEKTQRQLLLKVLQKIQELSPNRDILGRYRFIEDNEFGITGQSPGNSDSLPLPTTEFVWIFPGIARIEPYCL
jgi:hypothetical protein